MGMRRRIAKEVGKRVVPKLTFAAKQVATKKAASWAMNRVSPSRRRQNRNRVIGLGAAVIALPIGLWLGRRFLMNKSDTM